MAMQPLSWERETASTSLSTASRQAPSWSSRLRRPPPSSARKTMRWERQIPAGSGRSPREEGFYQDSISLDTGERGGYLGISEHPEYRKLMNARCTGEAMSAFIELYGKTGHRPFIELPLRVLRFYAAHQLADGEFIPFELLFDVAVKALASALFCIKNAVASAARLSACQR